MEESPLMNIPIVDYWSNDVVKDDMYRNVLMQIIWWYLIKGFLLNMFEWNICTQL